MGADGGATLSRAHRSRGGVLTGGGAGLWRSSGLGHHRAVAGHARAFVAELDTMTADDTYDAWREDQDRARGLMEPRPFSDLVDALELAAVELRQDEARHAERWYFADRGDVELEQRRAMHDAGLAAAGARALEAVLRALGVESEGVGSRVPRHYRRAGYDIE